MGICPGICGYFILDGRYGAVATLRKEPGPYVGGGTTPVHESAELLSPGPVNCTRRTSVGGAMIRESMIKKLRLPKHWDNGLLKWPG